MSILRLSTDLQTDLISKLTNQADVRSLLDFLVDRARKALNADACSVYLEDPQPRQSKERIATMRAASGYQQYAVGKAVCAVLQPYEVIPNPGDDEKLGLTGWVMSTGKPFLATSANDLFGHPHWSGKFDQKQMPEQELRLATFLAVPLRDLHGKIIGVLKAERLDDSNTNQFSVSDQIVLEARARVAARCIVYAEDAQRESSDAAVIAWALNIIAEAVATEGDLDAFLDIVVRVIAAATEADSCAVFLIDESKKTLTQRAGWGSQELRKVIRSYKRPDRSQVIGCENDAKCNPPHCDGAPALEEAQRVGLTAWVAATGKSFHASNFGELRKHCHHLGRYDKPNYEGNQTCGAWLGVPLRVGGTIVGVLKIENISEIGTPDDRDFDLQIERRLDVLAQDIALAIERLQSQSPARFRVIHQAMPTIREILQGERDVPKLVELVVKKTAELFSARACALFLKEGERLIQPEWAAVGWAERGPTVRDYDLGSTRGDCRLSG